MNNLIATTFFDGIGLVAKGCRLMWFFYIKIMKN